MTVGASSLFSSAFAAGVADKLIEIGVRCVVAAGWAVEDGPAETFATTFYRELLAGASFVDAVGAAREAAWADDPSGKTWAAYQCYGDPGWTLRTGSADAQAARRAVGDEYASLASPLGLAFALEELAVQTRWSGAAAAAQLEKARHLEARFGVLWGGMGAVAEAFGLAYAEAGDFEAAITWYERAVQAEDGSASMKTNEQLQNLRARLAWQTVAGVAPTAAALKTGRAGIQKAIAQLQSLADGHPTVERLSLLGSARKRLAMLEQRAGDADAARRALDAAAAAYGQAETLAAGTASSEIHYPALNRMALELVIHGADPGWQGLDAVRTQAARDQLLRRAQSDPDFWSAVGQVEIELYAALAQRRLAAVSAGLADAYADIHARVSSAKPWRTVADQARFVLEPVLARAQGAERRAVAELLDILLGYAGAEAAV